LLKETILLRENVVQVTMILSVYTELLLLLFVNLLCYVLAMSLFTHHYVVIDTDDDMYVTGKST